MLPGGNRGLGVASGLFEIVQDDPGFPGFSSVAEGLITYYGVLQLAAGVVIALQFYQGIGEVITDSPFVDEIAQCGINIRGLVVEGDRLFQAPHGIIKISQFAQRAGFPSAVLLLHLQSEGLPIGMLGLVKPSGVSMYHANSMPGGCHGAWLTQGGKEVAGCLVGRQGVVIALLQQANGSRAGLCNRYIPLVTASFITLNRFFIHGGRLLQPPQLL